MVLRLRDSCELASSGRGDAFHSTSGPFFSRSLYISTLKEQTRKQRSKTICKRKINHKFTQSEKFIAFKWKEGEKVHKFNFGGREKQ